MFFRVSRHFPHPKGGQKHQNLTFFVTFCTFVQLPGAGKSRVLLKLAIFGVFLKKCQIWRKNALFGTFRPVSWPQKSLKMSKNDKKVCFLRFWDPQSPGFSAESAYFWHPVKNTQKITQKWHFYQFWAILGVQNTLIGKFVKKNRIFGGFGGKFSIGFLSIFVIFWQKSVFFRCVPWK